MRNRSVAYSTEAAFHALSDPTRRAVLDLLRQGVQPAGQIARAFPVSRPAISKHLRLLRRAHLVQEKREGRHRLYQLNPEPLKAVDSWLQQYRVFWQVNLTNLKTFVRRSMRRKRRQSAGSSDVQSDYVRSTPRRLGIHMKPAVLYKIASLLLLLFAAGHTFGFLRFRPPSVEGRAVYEAMNSVHFQVRGSKLQLRWLLSWIWSVHHSQYAFPGFSILVPRCPGWQQSPGERHFGLGSVRGSSGFTGSELGLFFGGAGYAFRPCGDLRGLGRVCNYSDKENVMKSRYISISLLVFAATLAFAASAANQSFERLKSLDGTWEGKTPDGQTAQVTYRVTANGSALMSEIKGKEDMISMFNLDGDRVVMTHYCAAGNQPRMVASSSPDRKTFTFDFLDATNLATSDAGHMTRMVLSMPEANHHTEEWIYTDHGKEMKEVFDLWRKK